MASHNIDVFLLFAEEFYVFCKYWPVDGLLRPKRVANNRKITV